MDASLQQLRTEQLRAAVHEHFGEINEAAWERGGEPKFKFKTKGCHQKNDPGFGEDGL